MTNSIKTIPSVLVVEDDPRAGAEIEGILRGSGQFQLVGRCDSPEEAIRLAKRHCPAVVLIDLILQERECTDAITKLHQVIPESTVLVLTVIEDADLIVRALEAGARGYLLKAEGFRSLSKRVQDALLEGAPVSPRVARRLCETLNERGRLRRDSGFDALDKTDLGVLECLASGLTNREIARSLDVGYEVVKSRVERIFEKLQVTRRAQAASLFGRLAAYRARRHTHMGSPLRSPR